MKLKLALILSLLAPLALTACAKQEQAGQGDQQAAATQEMSPEQQAAIDAIDKPVMDENNTDIAAANTSPAAENLVTSTAETDASAAQTASPETAVQ